DVSYGVPSNIDQMTLIGPDAPCRWVVPSLGPDPSWRQSGFNDGSWNAALQGIGYDRNTSGVNFLPLIGAGGNTEGDMFNKRTSCYLRVPFSLPDGTDVLGLTLKVNYDDGFAAWMNGQPLL